MTCSRSIFHPCDIYLVVRDGVNNDWLNHSFHHSFSVFHGRTKHDLQQWLWLKSSAGPTLIRDFNISSGITYSFNTFCINTYVLTRLVIPGETLFYTRYKHYYADLDRFAVHGGRVFVQSVCRPHPHSHYICGYCDGNQNTLLISQHIFSFEILKRLSTIGKIKWHIMYEIWDNFRDI